MEDYKSGQSLLENAEEINALFADQSQTEHIGNELRRITFAQKKNEKIWCMI